jgi:hypothetical protein
LYGEEHESGIHITGRIVLNLWRRLRAELKLQSYNRTYVTLEFLDKRVAYFSQEQLLRWFIMFWLFIVGLFCYICIFYYLYFDSLMPLAGLHFCVGLDFVTPSL